MELNLFIGRAGSGKSQECINKISGIVNDNPSEKVFLIVPDQFMIEAEERLLSAIKSGGLIENEVLSFKRLSHWVADRYGGIKKPVLNSIGKSLILALAVKKVSSKLEFYKNFVNNPWNSSKLLQLTNEFMRYGITEDDLSDASKKLSVTDKELSFKLADLSLIYSYFRKLLSEEFSDEIQVHGLIMENLRDHEPFKDSTVWIDEFDGFTTPEYEIISELIKQCKSVNVTLTFDKNGEYVFSSVRKTYQDLKRIAGECSAQFREYTLGGTDILPRYKKSPALFELQSRFGKYPTEKYEGDASDIILVECQDKYEEVYNCALEIQKLCKEGGYFFKDIAVVARNIEEYQEKVKLIFDKMGIEYFCDSKEKTDRFPVSLLVMDALDCLINDFSQESVFSFLKSECLINTDLSDVCKLENYAYCYGIKGKRKWNIPIAENPGLDNLRDFFINGFNRFSEDLKNAENYAEAADAIYSLLEYFNVFEYAEIMKEQKSGVVVDAIDEILSYVKMFLKDESSKAFGAKRTAEEMKAILINAFAGNEIAEIPQNNDVVKIGNADRTRTGKIKALFILGANEGTFPAQFSDNGLLSDSERELLKTENIVLAESIKFKTDKENYLLYKTVSAPEEKLYISYCNFEGKDKAYPSQLVRRTEMILPNPGRIKGKSVNEITSVLPERENAVLFSAGTFISDEYAGKIYPDYSTSVAGVSGLEAFADCPLRFFFSKGMKTGALKKYEIDIADTGILVHALIEKGVKELMNRFPSSKADFDSCLDIINDVEKSPFACGNTDIFSDSHKNRFITDKIKMFAAECLMNISNQSFEESYKPFRLELSFGGEDSEIKDFEIENEDGTKMKLSGRIDRCDIAEKDGVKYFRIIDYKSSQKNISQKTVEEGKTLQLISYMDVVLNEFDKEAKPGGVFYYQVPMDILKSDSENYKLNGLTNDEDANKEALCDYKYVKEQKKTGLIDAASFELLIGRNRENIFKINNRIRKGDITPNKSSTCDYCAYKTICALRCT